MFRYVNDDEHVKLTVNGDLADLLSNVCIMVHTLYEKLPDDVRESFKEQVMESFAEGLPFKTGKELAEHAQQLILNKVKELFAGMEENKDA